jgi:hypothetical protein
MAPVMDSLTDIQPKLGHVDVRSRDRRSRNLTDNRWSESRHERALLVAGALVCSCSLRVCHLAETEAWSPAGYTRRRSARLAIQAAAMVPTPEREILRLLG